ncbi:SAM-dependent methyltransferase [Actinopolymorpha alba]|uniref:SAM-dependent methyltransferase n=1 Tax=Actinopolymorpha alba TaxID=533267 RepID=UPI0003656219|nr:class I SAM-dependent methyltransferase [Actinopolymorpha alba]
MSQPPAPGYYEFLDFNAPLSDARAESIAGTIASGQPARIVDLGCGWGELLLRALAMAPTATGWGVDSDAETIKRGRANASNRGLADRVTFTVADLSAMPEPADAVICVGADHAFGDQREAMRSLHSTVRPGGRLLLGTGFWEHPPTVAQAASVGMAPDSLHDLAGLVDLAIQAGFRPLSVQTASRDEWEQFESGYLADWESWLISYGHTPGADDIRRMADKHRNEWLRGYREVLGFAYLMLARPFSAEEPIE